MSKDLEEQGDQEEQEEQEEQEKQEEQGVLLITWTEALQFQNVMTGQKVYQKYASCPPTTFRILTIDSMSIKISNFVFLKKQKPFGLSWGSKKHVYEVQVYIANQTHLQIWTNRSVEPGDRISQPVGVNLALLTEEFLYVIRGESIYAVCSSM